MGLGPTGEVARTVEAPPANSGWLHPSAWLWGLLGVAYLCGRCQARRSLPVKKPQRMMRHVAVQSQTTYSAVRDAAATHRFCPVHAFTGEVEVGPTLECPH